MFRTMVQVSAYPLVITGAIALFAALQAQGAGLLAATYIPVVLGAVAVTGLEWMVPHRKEWIPEKGEVWHDVLFMFSIQMLLPKLLSFLAAFLLLDLLNGLGLGFRDLWPHHWSSGVQVVLMILGADFMRYWLHRWSHEARWLWRFHAVHHSPDRLYWLNVGRFHPIDKGLQFLCDALPFIILSVSADVLGLYFVFYAVNGFFQHSNIDLRMGVLNWIVSGPQLHRWHHSKVIAESDSNYGNNLIIWDVVFGSRFFPESKRVGDLGLLNRKYPKDFLSQMKTPFSGNVDKQDLPLQSLKGGALNVLLKWRMKFIGKNLYRPLVKAAEDPEHSQTRVLLSLIKRNENTEFGREHHFRDIHSIEEYRQRVPVRDYEAFRPYVEKQERRRRPVLTTSFPLMYNVTSGTTGEPKYIPVVEDTLDALRRSQKISAWIQYRYCREAFQGSLFGMVSPAVEGALDSGTPYGSASGHIYKSMPRLARSKYVLPPEVFEIENPEAKYYVMARLALARRDITFLGAANPSSFLKLQDVLEKNLEDLIKDVRNGTCKSLNGLGKPIVSAIQKRLHADAERASEMRSIKNEGDVSFSRFWPWIKLVVTWTGGSCGISLKSVLSNLPPGVRIIDVGYLASEVRGTITVDPATSAGVPTLTENFFEFVRREDWENHRAEFRTLANLQEGEEYYVFVTTSAGLYRYDMNDIVKAVGKFHKTPQLQFIQKGKGVTNVTGEKLYEGQLLNVMESVSREADLTVRFWQALADEKAGRYEVYFEGEGENLPESLAGQLDASLQNQNIEYAAKRKSGRLKPLAVYPLRAGAWEAYRSHYLRRGQRESQFKPAVLQYKSQLDFPIEDWMEK